MKKRYRTVTKWLKRTGTDAFLVSDMESLFYFSGFSSERNFLVVFRDGSIKYFVDNMNAGLAGKNISSSDIMIIQGYPLKNLLSAFKHYGVRKLGVQNGKITLGLCRDIEKKYRKIELIDATDMISSLRECKMPDEIDVLRKAARKTSRIWNRAKRNIDTGMREVDLAKLIDVMIREEGCTNSFPTIAAFGKNSADPHAIPSNYRLKDNDIVLVDFGLKLKGYCSDLTRVMPKGRINRTIRKLQYFVSKAQDDAIKLLKPGREIGYINRQINKYFADNNLDEYILHGLGHGVGLEVHESPSVASSVKRKLKKNMVITIEPGLYVRGLGGIRIEDMVLITEKGCEVLSR